MHMGLDDARVGITVAALIFNPGCRFWHSGIVTWVRKPAPLKVSTDGTYWLLRDSYASCSHLAST